MPWYFLFPLALSVGFACGWIGGEIRDWVLDPQYCIGEVQIPPMAPDPSTLDPNPEIYLIPVPVEPEREKLEIIIPEDMENIEL